MHEVSKQCANKQIHTYGLDKVLQGIKIISKRTIDEWWNLTSKLSGENQFVRKLSVNVCMYGTYFRFQSSRGNFNSEHVLVCSGRNEQRHERSSRGWRTDECAPVHTGHKIKKVFITSEIISNEFGIPFWSHSIFVLFQCSLIAHTSTLDMTQMFWSPIRSILFFDFEIYQKFKGRTLIKCLTSMLSNLAETLHR